MKKKILQRKQVIKILVCLMVFIGVQVGYCEKVVNAAEVTFISSSSVDVRNLTIKIDKKNYTYTGEKIKPKVKVYNGSTLLTNDKDYTLSYNNNKNVGVATVTIIGKGSYSGSVKKEYYILPKATQIKSVLLNSKFTKATIEWKKDKNADGYAIYVATSEKGNYKKVKVVTDKDVTSCVIKDLKAKKTYYFKIRSFISVNGKRIYSEKYSKAKSNTGLLSEITLNSPMSGKNRNYNLKLASSKINGTVLKPGDEFNWFKVVGSASKEKGYRKAGIFVDGVTVQGYGGGVCQVSSTLYQASKKAKLKIVERHTHSKNVPYTKKGEDATVAYGSRNLRIKNNKKYAIRIVAYNDKTKTICKLYRVTD